jgi:hypothetical protein
MILPVISLLALAVAVTLTQMPAWGLSMAVVAAIDCYIVFGVLWG